MRHVAGKVDESDSVGTSGRKGRENTVAFGMGTLGLRRLGVGSEVLCEALSRKESKHGGGGADRKGRFKGSRGWTLWLPGLI